MIGNDIARLFEPELGKLIEYLSLEWDQTQNVIKGREAVGCNEDELIVSLVNVAYFAAAFGTKKTQVNSGECLA